MHDRVLVLGAGLTGLAAADDLAAAGVPCLVLERSPTVGGLAGGLRRNGFSFDYGPHRFHTPDPRIESWFTDLFPDGAWLRPRRKSEIQLVGRRFAYPLELGDVVRKLDFTDNARAFSDYLVSSLRRALSRPDEASFEDWVVNRFGRTLYDLYFKPYTEKLWGVPTREISPDWAAQRISLVSLFDVLKRLLSRGSGKDPRTYAREFLYPEAGIGELPRRLAARAVSRGAEIRLDAEVVALKVREGAFEVEVKDADGKVYRESGSAVVSTVPLAELVGFIEPRPGAEVLRATRGLRSRSVVFLHLTLDGETPSDNHWIYFPEPGYVFNRVSEPANFSPKLTPPGCAAITAEVSCDVGDRFWRMGLGELCRKNLSGLASVGLLKKSPRACAVSRRPHAYPLYDRGYGERFKVCLEHVNRHPGLITTGRQGLFRYGNMDHAVVMGRKAALSLRGKMDREEAQAVGTTQEYFG
ncbi:MAG TPA: FAD-dependent oxidoreductase [bacterium]|nr:FAD-dependent oxidoreductase [bacterium]